MKTPLVYAVVMALCALSALVVLPADAAEARAENAQGLPGTPWNVTVKIFSNYVDISWYASKNYAAENITHFNIYKYINHEPCEQPIVSNVSRCEDDFLDNDFDGLVDEPKEGPYYNYYLDVDVKEGIYYSYAIASVNAIGESPRSELAGIQFGEKKATPGFGAFAMIIAILGMAIVLKVGIKDDGSMAMLSWSGTTHRASSIFRIRSR